jgi:hypothetical protein
MVAAFNTNLRRSLFQFRLQPYQRSLQRCLFEGFGVCSRTGSQFFGW